MKLHELFLVAQSLYGLNGLESNDSKSPLINQAAMTTLPIALNDVYNGKIRSLHKC